ncbi:MAG: hypothetical protein AAF485_29990 [Chloroflexota bacterium]
MDIFIDERPSRSLVKPRLGLNINWKRFSLPLTIFCVALIPRIMGLSTFLTADEDDQIMFAHAFLKAALQGDWFEALFITNYPGIPTLILVKFRVTRSDISDCSGLCVKGKLDIRRE